MPNAYLQWIDYRQQVQRLKIVDKVFIGRTCKGVDCQKRILLDEPLISRDHAVISRNAAQLSITDSSKNGTWVNATRMASGSTKDLVDGDTIRIGESSFRVIYSQADSPNGGAGANSETTILRTAEVVVTSLIADVREFSEFSQTHTSKEVYALIKEIFERFSIIVDDYQGTIKDYAGDAVYAFWDHAIEPIRTQAVLACQAAIKQTQTINEIRTKLSGKNIASDNLQMGWGITTGKVTMSHYGSRAADLALVGDCTNLAFRLSGLANKQLSEKIVICSQTAELIRNDLKIKDLGNVEIKGRTGKEHVFGLAQL